MYIQAQASMLKKIMAKLKFGSYKIKLPVVNTSNPSEKTNSEQEEDN